MQAIEIETEISESHEIHLQLPPTIQSGKAKVLILYDQQEAKTEQTPRQFGQFRGQLEISDDFNEPLPDSFWLGQM